MATLTASMAMKARVAALPPAARTSSPAAQGARVRPAPARLPSTLRRATSGPAKPVASRNARIASADSAQLERKERQAALYAQLRELAAALFAGAPVPMMCGIRSEIIKRLELNDTNDLAALRAILRELAAQPAYLAALAAEGAVRRDLDGEPVEPVSDAHRVSAQKALEKLRHDVQTDGAKLGKKEAW